MSNNEFNEKPSKLYNSNLSNSSTNLLTSESRVLILIGYYDDASIHDITSFFQTEHLYIDSMKILNGIITSLFIHDYLEKGSIADRTDSNSQNAALKNLFDRLDKSTIYHGQKLYSNKNISVDIINSNVSCIENYEPYAEYLKSKVNNPNASEKHLLHSEINIVNCEKQEKQTQLIMTALNNGLLKNYTHFIYIGHSRLGKGLGLGPFTDENTFSMQFYNNLETGDLQNVIMASCESEKYYKKAIEKLGINFISLPTLTANSEKQFWTRNANWAIHIMIQQWGM